MKTFAFGVLLLLIVPMLMLNPLGRPAFLGYYLGVLATWTAYIWALRYGGATARQN